MKRKAAISITEAPIGSKEDKALWRMIFREWPDKGYVACKEQLFRYAKNKKFFSTAVVLLEHGKVIGGVHLSDHPLYLRIFRRKFLKLKGMNLIRADDLIIAPEKRGKKLGKWFLAQIIRKYLKDYSGIIFHSRMPYIQKFYLRIGAKMLFDGRKFGQKYRRAYKRKVLKKRSVFLFSKKELAS